VNAKGIHVIRREPLASSNPGNHPVSPSWDEMDAIVVFDDVVIPCERVFYLRRS
jgi:4-hydroxyphenylacetate 3-monooxygenase